MIGNDSTMMRQPAGDAFGDTGHVIASDTPPAPPRAINWPTVLASAGVAAVVSSVILAIGVIGLHRDGSAGAQASAEPAVIRVVTDGAGSVSAVQDGADAAADGADEGAGADSAADSSGGAPAHTRQPDVSSAVPPSGLSATEAGQVAPGGGSPAGAQVAPGGGSPAGAQGADEGAQENAAGGRDAEAGPESAEADDPAADTAAGTATGTAEAAPAGEVTAWAPASPLPGDFAVTTTEPNLDDLNAIVYFLTAMPASDAAKARSIEAGQAGVIVPNTVYNLGLFRAPRGWSRVTGPVQRSGDSVTATLHAHSAGIPAVTMPITFVYADGTWRLSSSSLCAGVKTVGLPIYCNG